MPTNLNPKSETSSIILSSTGSKTQVAAAVPFGTYTGSHLFLTGASLQVAYVYKKLGGDVVDIELTPANVYASYEEAVLEYSYIINIHQAKNSLGDVLGAQTGTFNYNGEITSGPSGSNLKYPRFYFSYARKTGDGAAAASGFGGTITEYSASFSPSSDQQDYDLQQIIETASAANKDDQGNAIDYGGKVKNRRIIITQVFYKSPRAMWRFYGYYGGVGVVGNMSTYGQFADDSTFEVVPTWQNKLQAMMYEDSLMTRTSNYSYELINNRLRLFPNPSYWDFGALDRVWVRFYVNTDAWEEDESRYQGGIMGVNNMNTLPFDNLPYKNINAIGKQWIRKYSLALCKEMLGQVRGKFQTIPIPGDSVTLNHADLLSQAKEEQQELKDKLTEMLKEVEYTELIKKDVEKSDAATAMFKNTPVPIYVG
tara:strand:+ start:957 stop:2231 length:1275 start_codon:yes stop_codon:yes gene_type:complete